MPHSLAAELEHILIDIERLVLLLQLVEDVQRAVDGFVHLRGLNRKRLR